MYTRTASGLHLRVVTEMKGRHDAIPTGQSENPYAFGVIPSCLSDHEAQASRGEIAVTGDRIRYSHTSPCAATEEMHYRRRSFRVFAKWEPRHGAFVANLGNCPHDGQDACVPNPMDAPPDAQGAWGSAHAGCSLHRVIQGKGPEQTQHGDCTCMSVLEMVELDNIGCAWVARRAAAKGALTVHDAGVVRITLTALCERLALTPRLYFERGDSAPGALKGPPELADDMSFLRTFWDPVVNADPRETSHISDHATLASLGRLRSIPYRYGSVLVAQQGPQLVFRHPYPIFHPLFACASILGRASVRSDAIIDFLLHGQAWEHDGRDESLRDLLAKAVAAPEDGRGEDRAPPRFVHRLRTVMCALRLCAESVKRSGASGTVSRDPVTGGVGENAIGHNKAMVGCLLTHARGLAIRNENKRSASRSTVRSTWKWPRPHDSKPVCECDRPLSDAEYNAYADDGAAWNLEETEKSDTSGVFPYLSGPSGPGGVGTQALRCIQSQYAWCTPSDGLQLWLHPFTPDAEMIRSHEPSLQEMPGQEFGVTATVTMWCYLPRLGMIGNHD